MRRTKPSYGAQPNFADPLMRGLVKWFLLNEGSGNVVYDLSLSRGHGTLTNFTYPPTGASGWVSSAGLNFDGSNDYVGITALALGTTFSIFMWIKPFTVAGYDTLVSETVNREMTLNAGKINYYDGTIIINGNTTLTINRWWHVGLVSNLKVPSMTTYLNGISDGTNTSAATNNFSPVRIGLNPSNAEPFHGQMDDLRIYNRALSQAEILRLYSNPYSMFKRNDNILYSIPPTPPSAGTLHGVSSLTGINSLVM